MKISLVSDFVRNKHALVPTESDFLAVDWTSNVIRYSKQECMIDVLDCLGVCYGSNSSATNAQSRYFSAANVSKTEQILGKKTEFLYKIKWSGTDRARMAMKMSDMAQFLRNVIGSVSKAPDLANILYDDNKVGIAAVKHNEMISFKETHEIQTTLTPLDQPKQAPVVNDTANALQAQSSQRLQNVNLSVPNYQMPPILSQYKAATNVMHNSLPHPMQNLSGMQPHQSVYGMYNGTPMFAYLPTKQITCNQNGGGTAETEELETKKIEERCKRDLIIKRSELDAKNAEKKAELDAKQAELDAKNAEKESKKQSLIKDIKNAQDLGLKKTAKTLKRKLSNLYVADDD